MKPDLLLENRSVEHTHPSDSPQTDGESEMPLVTVVIPTHNRSKLLKRAITSVLAQDCKDFELIVVDDDSTDDTLQTIMSFASQKIRYIKHASNYHASISRNTGIEHAKGEYLAFLDDDDEWSPGKLSAQLDLMSKASPEVGLIYCWLDYINSQGEKVFEVHPTLRGDVFLDVLDMQRLGNSSTLLVKLSAANEVGGFDKTLPRGNDGDFIRRICQLYHVDVVPEVLVKMHVDHGHERITSTDEQGIRNAIWSEETKLRKFPDVLKRHPNRAATIYTSIALHYARLGSWRQFLLYQIRAFTRAPLYPRVYLRFLLGCRYNIFG